MTRLPLRPLLGVLPLIVFGCQGGSGPITAQPDDWAPFVGQTVTVYGTAGNTSQGAIVRLTDGGYVPLLMREKWGIDAVTRPVSVTGEVVASDGVRAEPFAIKVTKIDIAPPDATGGKGSSGRL